MMLTPVGTLVLAALAGARKPASPPAAPPAPAASPAPAAAATLDALLRSRALETTTNPVAAGFVLEEGKAVLPEALRAEAESQLEKALLAEMDPIHNMFAGMSNVLNSDAMQKAQKDAEEASKPSNIIKSMLGLHQNQPRPQDQAQQAREAQQAINDPWIRGLAAASALARMGEAKAAAQYYVDCFQFVPQDWLPGLCLDQLLEMGPKRSAIVLNWMLKDADTIGFAGMAGGMTPPPGTTAGAPNPIAVNIRAAALEGLGALAADPRVAPEEREAAFSSVFSYAQGDANRPYFAGAARGLGRARDPRGVPLLREIAKSRKDPVAQQAALEALGAGFADPKALAALREQAADGRDAVRALRAARVLIRSGDEAALAWAVGAIDEKRAADTETPDLRPEIVRELVEAGGDKGKAALARALAGGPGNDWLGAWLRVALLETGDVSRLAAVAEDLRRDDWTLDKRSAMSVFRQVVQTAEMVAQGSHYEAIKAIYNFAAAQRDAVLAKAEKRQAAVERLRWQAADAIAAARPAGGLAVVAGLLDDDTPAVRLSAAAALARLAGPGSLDAIARAYDLDYGSEKGVPRAPEVRAVLLRAAAALAPADPKTQALLAEASRSDDATIRLVALAYLSLATSAPQAEPARRPS